MSPCVVQAVLVLVSEMIVLKGQVYEGHETGLEYSYLNQLDASPMEA